MYFLPDFPLQLNALSLFGVLLLAGLIGGELARRTRFLPQIFGYTVMGFLLSPNFFNIINQTALQDAKIFIQISLGLILFDLGRHLDFKWLKHDRGLLFSSLAESILTFIFVLIVLLFFHLPLLPALLAATFAIATSPAVVMLVSHDLQAQGPVTRRTLMLTSLNNFYSLVIFSILLPITLFSDQSNIMEALNHSIYRLFGSLALGFFAFFITKHMARLTQKYQMKQFVLIVSMVVLTIGLANLLNLSTMLSLFTLGVAVRNFDTQHALIEVDIAWLARPFLILLFVISGFYLQLEGLWLAGIIVLAFICARMFAKFLGVYLFAKKSHLTTSQSLAIGLALTPMGAVAIGMYSILETSNPEFTHQLSLIITAVLTVFNLLGPIATQFAFIKSKEV